MGKFNIWAAKMKAAITPMRGICFSPKLLLVFETANPTITRVITQNINETTRVKNPSGICKLGGE
jgi:hypothetical protein